MNSIHYPFDLLQKIDQKNSWALNLIDNLDEVLEAQPKESANITNFTAASVTLDASVKIYSNRVDSVLATTKTLAAGFHNLHEDAEQADPEQHDLAPKRKDGDYDEGGDDDDAEQPAKNETGNKKERRRVVAASTLCTPDSITLSKFDLAFEVDPLFTKTSAQFDEGGARGLLLNHLSVYNDCDIIFDSNDHIQNIPRAQSLTTFVPLGELQDKLRDIIGHKLNLHICDTFSNFTFGQAQEVQAEDQVDGKEKFFELG